MDKPGSSPNDDKEKLNPTKENEPRSLDASEDESENKMGSHVEREPEHSPQRSESKVEPQVESVPGPSSQPVEACIRLELDSEKVKFTNSPQAQHEEQENPVSESTALSESSAPTTRQRSRVAPRSEPSAFWRFFDWSNLSMEQTLCRFGIATNLCMILALCILYALYRLIKYLTGFYQKSGL